MKCLVLLQVTPEVTLKLIYILLRMPFYLSDYFWRAEVDYISKGFILGFGSYLTQDRIWGVLVLYVPYYVRNR